MNTIMILSCLEYERYQEALNREQSLVLCTHFRESEELSSWLSSRGMDDCDRLMG